MTLREAQSLHVKLIAQDYLCVGTPPISFGET